MYEIERYILLLLLAFAVGQDLHDGKIRNSLIVLGCLSGLTFVWFGGDGMRIGSRYIGFLLPLLGMYVLYVVKAFGAGDIKLFAVVGSFLGVSGVIRCVVVSFFVAAIYGCIELVVKGSLTEAISDMTAYLQSCYTQRKLLPWPEDKGTTICFSVAILSSVWLYLEGWI